MSDVNADNPSLILSPGTQVVSLVEHHGRNGSLLVPRGGVGVVTRSPADNRHSYFVRFPDGFEAALAFHRGEYERLGHLLEEAGRSSVLPERPTARPALNDLLVRLRMKTLGHGSPP